MAANPEQTSDDGLFIEVPDVVPDIDIWQAQSQEYVHEQFTLLCERLLELGIEPSRQHSFRFMRADGHDAVLAQACDIINVGPANETVRGQRIIVNQLRQQLFKPDIIDVSDYLLCFQNDDLICVHSQISLIKDQGIHLDNSALRGPWIRYRQDTADLICGKDYYEKLFRTQKFRQDVAAMHRLMAALRPFGESTRD